MNFFNGNERLYFDGGYGTLLQTKGLKPGELPELWNITHSDVIKDLHKNYLLSGSNFITTNTFGANTLKYSKEELENIISSAINNVKNAITETNSKNAYIALDIGPLGKLLKPLGDLEFEEAVSIFKETVLLGVKYGADLIIIETMNDSYETKAAVLAAKENSNLPVFVTNAYDESGKLMTGATPEAMVAMLEGLGVDALGVNCSVGPNKLLNVVERLTKCSSIPVIVNPNAGLPIIENGETKFDISPKQFAEFMMEMAKMGAYFLGGCCGTTPEYIKETKLLCDDIKLIDITNKNRTVISSYTHEVLFDKKPIIIGERINPTGKKAFKNALINNDLDYILSQGTIQQDAGADVLDVNVGLPEIDEKEVLKNVIFNLQGVSDLPLQIDTSNISAMENAMRIYNGKPLINSVNGKEESMREIFPLVKKYGGVVIALTIDENGISENWEERVAIAEKIINVAESYGIKKHDIIVDPLAMTVSTDKNSALTTLKCVEELTNRGIKTSLGVSNVSFGLPNRMVINSTFFALALSKGLSAGIINPNSKEMMDTYYGFCALNGLDENFERFINYSVSTTASKNVEKTTESNPEEELKYAIKKGISEKASYCTEKLLVEKDSMYVINNCIIPSLDEVGQGFESNKIFLPQLLMCAEAAKSSFNVIKSKFTNNENEKKAKVIIATVKGDIHDIGKNIVKVLLENYDYDVLDLGKDVAPEVILSEAKNKNIKIVGLSALMTTTVPAMEETIKLLKKEIPEVKVLVGGAVLTKDYAKEINADFYCKDAMETVRNLELIINE